MHNVAALVGEDLDFDVPGIDDELFDENAIVAEGAPGLGLRRKPGRTQPEPKKRDRVRRDKRIDRQPHQP